MAELDKPDPTLDGSSHCRGFALKAARYGRMSLGVNAGKTAPRAAVVKTCNESVAVDHENACLYCTLFFSVIPSYCESAAFS